MAAHALLSHQLLLHHHLGGDAGVVAARVPQRGLAAHPVPEGGSATAAARAPGSGLARALLPSSQRVLDGVGESVTQVERPRHVGRRDTHHEDPARVLLADTLPLREAEGETVLVFGTETKELSGLSPRTRA